MGANKWWKIGLFLTSLLSTAAAQETPPIRISIVTYDIARVGSKALHQAERLSAAILRTATIQSTWEAGAAEELENLGMDFTAYTGKDCQTAAVWPILRVQILPRAPGGLPRNALGFSLPCSRSGVQITIYEDRVAKVSEDGGPTLGRVLGYAMAHELGHVLLNSGTHEAAGLMKGIWSKSDWQRAAVDIIPFSPAEARQIAALHQRMTAANAAQLASLNAH
jgi:hypothetical protein